MYVSDERKGTQMEKTLVERIMQGEDIPMEEIIAGAAKENKIYLKDMNGFEWHYFKIGIREGLRLAARIMEEVADRKEQM